MSVFRIIWREGNPGTNHVAIEIRRADDWSADFRLQGYLTLRTEDFRYFLNRLADPGKIEVVKGNKPSGMGVGRPAGVRPVMRLSKDRNKY